MARLALSLCGHVAVTMDGSPPPGPPLGAKTLALLAYLALEPGVHSREELMALLWGDFPEAKARASLRQALTHLRHALGDALHVSRASVALVGPIECDVDAVRHGGGDRDAMLAVDLSHFLADLSLRRCAAFDEWADATRRRLQRGQAAALAERVGDALARLDWREAADVADRWLAADPLSDDAARAAVEAHHLAGDRGAALAIYAEHGARVLAECGRPPDRALRSLAERIAHDAERANDSSASASARAAAPVPSFRAPLRGRDREWAALQRAWRTTTEGAGRVVIVEGVIGTGKSRLADDFARWVTSHGGTVLFGGAHESGAAVPFALLGDVLRSAVDAPGVAGADGQWLAELSRLVPELRQRLPGVPAPPVAAPADAWRLFEGAAQLLLALAAEQPVLVVLDDAQWCDADSASLAGFLVHRLARAAVLWCVTVTLGAAERGTPGMRLARVLRTTPEADVLRPGPLGEADVGAMLRELGGLPDTPAVRGLVHQLHRETRGSPLYIMELLRSLFARQLLTLTPDGAWRLSAEYADGRAADIALADLPEVRAPIEEQIGRLADDARDVLVTIAVADDTRCDTDLLSHVHGISRLRAAAIGEALRDRALVAECEGAYRCAHPVIATVVRSSVSASWRREVERAVAVLRERRVRDSGAFLRVTDVRAADVRAPDVRVPDARVPDARVPDARVRESPAGA
ncbi:MAG TPA: AAA family ATPase [Gemmatimonadaceae bacterium]|nr:AAA family ATPase [Gemmatimonadaceae bacterium]